MPLIGQTRTFIPLFHVYLDHFILLKSFILIHSFILRSYLER